MRRCNTLFGFIDRLGIFRSMMVFALALMLSLGGGNTGALGAAGAAVSALDIYQAYETGGAEAALQTAGIHAATAVVGGVVVRTGFKVGGVVYSRADAAWKAFTTANPHLAAAAQSAKSIRTAATPAKITPTPTQTATTTARPKPATTPNLNIATPVHKNSLQHAGETHVYKIYRVDDGKVHKVGISAQGVRQSDGKSIRGEAQARRLTPSYWRAV